jgi:hypothetical protein
MTALCFAVAAFPARAGTLFSDDAESGTVLKTEMPPGHWDDYTDLSANVSVTADPLAAHTGSFGLRFDDAESASGIGNVDYVGATISPGQSNVYFRAWIRVTGWNGVGDIDVIHIRNAQGSTSNVNVALDITAGGLIYIGGMDATGNYSLVTSFTLSVGRWYLVEMAALGAGTSGGSREVWFDGVSIHRRAMSWNSAAWLATRLLFGGPYLNDRRFMGAVDLDGIELSSTPLPSRLTLALPATSVDVGSCTPLDVGLLSSGGAVVGASSAVTAQLTAGPGSASFSSDPGCTMPLMSDSATLGAGVSSSRVYVMVRSEGGFTLTASSPNYLPGTVSGDALVSDAGVADGGGTAAPRRLTVGCGCTGSPWSAASEVALLLALRLHRRARPGRVRA